MSVKLAIVQPRNERCYYLVATENNCTYMSTNTFKTRQDAQQAITEWHAFFANNNTIKQTKTHGATHQLREFWEKI